MTHRPLILLVDDDKTVLDSLLNQLRSFFGREFTYEPATSVSEAWEVLTEAMESETTVQLVLSDWMLPSQLAGAPQGDQFLRQVNERYPHIPLAMLSGFADADSIERAKEIVPLVAYLTKPWLPDEVADVVRLAAKQTAHLRAS